ncbi:MAG: SMC family ATPase [Chloroflexi bacterium]|nr:SMC family ATPase [Chloroflexota bacterium]
MIPQRLSLKNFLCYREDVPTLELAGIHVACLCGPNGHGKSALLDAITWSLWGRARGKTQDDLVSYGADESRVELEFLARDTSYRVIRSHSRAGGRRRQGVTDLQLQVLSGDNAHPITGNTIRETQAKVDQIVGMDYDTFINSAFLLQGRADEFTNKTPAERKAVLAKIMGLETYDRLQERARERWDQSKTATAEVDGGLVWMRSQVEEIGDPASQLADLYSHLETVNKQLAEAREQVDGIRAQVAVLRQHRGQLDDLQEQIKGIQRDIGDGERSAAAGKERVQRFQDLIQQAESTRQGANHLAEARRRFELLEEARSRFDQLDQKRNLLVRSVDSARSRLEAEAEQLRHQVEIELTPKAQEEGPLTVQKELARQHLSDLERDETAVAAQRDHLGKVSVAIGETQSTAERYRVDGQEVRTKLELLKSSGDQDALCPLCGTPLGEDGCGRLAESYETDIQEKRRLYVQNQNQLKQFESEKSELEQDLASREQVLAGAQREGRAKLQELEHRIQQSRQAQGELEQATKRLTVLLASLDSADFAADEQSELIAIEAQVNALGYDEKDRQQSYAETRELGHFDERLRQLADAEEGLPKEQASLAVTEEMLGRRGIELDQLQEKYRTDTEAIAELPQFEAQLKQAETAYTGLEKTSQEATARQGYLEGQVRRQESLEQEIIAGSAKISALQEDESIYQELVTAFGRQGIQAMLIETVVPRLEEEANILLGRMTDNRMHLKLETQRERRTGRGDPIETLEINVNDELGPRSYEMYSGGEAFRINLALRIALSKVLAQRMGAPLPTLFIDEGFGSQDAAGRERVLDVISAIEDDFDMIIVITHLEEMKDAFPVRIEVQKGEFGSTFWLS